MGASRRALHAVCARALPAVALRYLALRPSRPWVPRFAADARHLCATVLDLKGALLARGDSAALAALLGALCGALCTRAAILSAPRDELAPAIDAACSFSGGGGPSADGGSPGVLSADEAVGGSLERLRAALAERASSGGGAHNSDAAKGCADGRSRGSLALAGGLGAGWEWLPDNLVEAFGAAASRQPIASASRTIRCLSLFQFLSLVCE